MIKVLPAASSKCSDEVQAVVALTQLNVLSVVPRIVIPAPSAVVLVGVATFARTTFLSSTTIVDVFRVVVLPLTVKSPVTIRLFPIVTFEGRPIVIAPVYGPEPVPAVIAISFVVPAIEVTNVVDLSLICDDATDIALFPAAVKRP